MPRKYQKLWTAAVVGCFTTLVLAAFTVHQSFRLTALSDVIQCLLLFSATMALIPQAVRSSGRLRLFWVLIATGIALWFAYQLLWLYFEVWLRTDVPDLFSGDMILFLHIVPLIAALALRPHAPQDEYAARLRHLDFALLIVWWGYLYVLFVIPWQYVVPGVAPYNDNLNSLYLIEKLVLLGALFMAWVGSRRGWKVFYANLFGACLTYSAGSYVANWALSRNSYYTGGFYDIPLVASMAWITLIGLWTREREPQAGVRSTSTSHGVWLARLGMIAAFSLPLFATWSLLDQMVPRIRSFRLVVTLITALVMGVMVFVRQRLLERELMRLLAHSRESFANLKRLQAQITESEKLASIGQLVGGAAHELNNPITAMLGYSDLLSLSKPLSPEQNDLATRIGQHARRTKALVASLVSFAKPSPSGSGPVDLNTLLRTAVKLSQPEWQALQIEVRTEFSPELLMVRGDSNQLLQVCVQIINDALHALEERNTSVLIIAAQQKDGLVLIDICDSLLGCETKDKAFSSTEIVSELGLGACQGILRQHHGRIFYRQDPTAGTQIRVELPAISAAAQKSSPVLVPAM